MGNSASALPYSIGNQVGSPQDHDGWAFHEGSKKADGSAVSVFQGNKPTMAKSPYDVKYSKEFQIFPAYHHYQNCKKLRHPYILAIHATLDTDYPNGDDPSSSTAANPGQLQGAQAMATTGDLIVVTEPCVPLQTWLAAKPSKEQLAWGLQCIVEALSFLHNSAKLSHGNVSPASFYVTPAGDVKLWNFSLVTPIGVADGGGGPTKYFREWEHIICPNSYRSPERRDARWEAVATSAVHCMDSYSLGVLIANWYGGDVPQQLQKAVQRLQTSSLKARPRLQPLLRCPIFDTPYRTVQKQLEEFSVQPVENKVGFWQGLPDLLQSNSIDQAVAVHKVFPTMKQSIMTITQSDAMMAQEMYRRELLAILPPLFYIAETYLAKDRADPNKFATEMSPLISKLFHVNDRGVRGALLGRTNLFTSQLDKNQLNASVFEPMCSGFADSSSALRELTLKATITLVPHLTQPNLEKLSRYLVRLQQDPESSIRTNTIIFIGKLAPHLTEISRQKMLLPAFVRAMKDPFDPCRLAAMKALQTSMDLFDPAGIAQQVLPTVTPCLLDSSSDVRRESFACVEACLGVLRKEDDRMSVIEAENVPNGNGGMGMVGGATSAANGGVPSGSATSQVTGGLSATKNVASHPPAPAPASGGYLSGLSSWMSSSSSAAPPPSAAPTAPTAPAPAAPIVPQPQFSSLGLNDTAVGGASGVDDDDGWGDDDINFGDTPSSAQSNTNSNMGGFTSIGAKVTAPAPSASNAWSEEEDFFKSFESKPGSKLSVGGTRSASTKGKLITPKTTSLAQRKTEMAQKKATKQKPDITKLTMDNDTNWDDF